MSNEMIETMIEEIMRMYHFGNYDDYNNEEIREHYRQMLKEGDTSCLSQKLTKN